MADGERNMVRTTPRDWRLWMASAFLLAVGTAGGAEPDHESGGSPPGGVWRYAESWVARHDANRDGRLVATEWQPLGGQPGEADANHDAMLSVDELAQYIAKYGSHRKIRLMPASFGGGVPLPSLLRPDGSEAKPQSVSGDKGPAEAPEEVPARKRTPAKDGTENAQDRSSERKYFVPPSRLPAGLPDWFSKGDRDGDGQLTLTEYAELGSASADTDFARYDRNQDGLITPREVLGRAADAKRASRPPATASGSERDLAVPKTDGSGEK